VNSPKVSICIPTYEQPENLRKCLLSISKQSFTDFEVVITDDSSSDDLLKVVDSFKNLFFIRYYKNKLALGSPENWNESIKHAEGKYIKILHHDDCFKREDSLERFVQLLDDNKGAKVAFSSSSHVGVNGECLSSHVLSDEKMDWVRGDPKRLFLGNLIGAPSIMIYDSSLSVTFDKRMKWLVDLDFYVRVLANSDFTYTKEELVSINVGEEERVTAVCQNNRVVNIYEAMLMLDKLDLSTISWRYKLYLLKLFIKFNICSKEDIRECGYNGEIRPELIKLLKCVRPLALGYKVLRK